MLLVLPLFLCDPDGVTAHRSKSCTEEEETEEEIENLLSLNLQDLLPKSNQRPRRVLPAFSYHNKTAINWGIQKQE